MLTPLLEFFAHQIDLEQDEIEAIQSNIHVQSFKKGTFLLRRGEISTDFYFLIKGCVRLFYEVDGEDKTAFFYTENDFVSSYESFTKQLPAKHGLQCIEDSELAIISQESAQKLLAFSPKFDAIARMIMEEELIVCQAIISDFITLSPEQRYQRLIEKNAQLILRVPQQYLATYLGIQPESLSRIKKRLANK